VDHVINRVLWKQFIAKLSNDWSSLALYVRSFTSTSEWFSLIFD
jgi:hypothetical protein